MAYIYVALFFMTESLYQFKGLSFHLWIDIRYYLKFHQDLLTIVVPWRKMLNSEAQAFKGKKTYNH